MNKSYMKAWTNMMSKDVQIIKPKFRLGMQKEERECLNCNQPIYVGESHIIYDSLINENCLCICCTLDFVLKGIPNAKSYKALVKELRARKVAGEL